LPIYPELVTRWLIPEKSAKGYSGAADRILKGGQQTASAEPMRRARLPYKRAIKKGRLRMSRRDGVYTRKDRPGTGLVD
jgi:hypothetical protein